MNQTASGVSIELQNRISTIIPSQSLNVLEGPHSHGPTQDTTEPAEIQQRVLDPVDGGFAAWRIICVAFVFEALLWGEQDVIVSRRVVDLVCNSHS